MEEGRRADKITFEQYSYWPCQIPAVHAPN